MISMAFIMLELRCAPLGASQVKGEPEPAEQDLLSPGGASLEQLALLSPQRADEVYNEFDFTDLSTPESDPITFSYGETVSASVAVDFEPFVHRAERQARIYHAFLKDLGETRSTAFRILQREWFFADNDFVTVHVCIER